MPRIAPKRRRRPETYWILDRDQIECLASARRQSILDRLCADGACPVREFAEAVGLKPTAAYHHLQRLLEVGLVEEAGRRVVSGKVEQLYRAVAPRMRLARAFGDPELAEPLRSVVSALCRQLDRDFDQGLDRDDGRSSGPGRNLGFFRIVSAPDAATLRRINTLLSEVAELLWKPPGRGDTLLSFGWTMAPIGRREPQ